MSETESNITSSIELGETTNTEHKQEIVNKMAEVATNLNKVDMTEPAEKSVESAVEQPTETIEISTPEQVSELMRSSKSKDEWNANTDKVKEAFKGYPAFWYSNIITSGLYNETSSGWEK